MPGWVGNGSYFSDDNVQYQTDFVTGARAFHNISVDYIGIWNERPWGSTDYVKKLRAALDAAGAQSTTIIGSDAVRNLPTDLLTAMLEDASFSSIVGIAGVHYACNRTVPPSFWSFQVCHPPPIRIMSSSLYALLSLQKPYGRTKTSAQLQIGREQAAGDAP